MLPAAIPIDEAERLADLYALKLLDTEPEERFDQIVELAAHLFEVPVAYIALVDSNRQWFKAQCGLDVAQTPRDISFCGHAILQNEPLIISDATQEERFADNPMVVGEPFVRFYAGYPLAGLKGKNVGTLCLVDKKPRLLTKKDLRTFHQLAKLAEQQLQMIDLIKAQQELIAARRALAETQKRLQRELSEAAGYVQSLLPDKLRGKIQIDWEFHSSSQLGGDLFGYHWLDPDHLALYLHDVSGHGIGASLLAISIHATLRREALPNTSFLEPGEVLTALNRAFPMEEHQGKFFTIWYGVYHCPTGSLRYANGGHPPPLVLHPDQSWSELDKTDPVVGVISDLSYGSQELRPTTGSRLYLFSDGAFEIHKEDGSMLGIPGLMRLCQQTNGSSSRVKEIVAQIHSINPAEALPDDLSLLEVTFAS